MIDASLDFALEFLVAHPNWYIFPILRLEKDPPLVKDNLESNASNDPAQIREWHKRWRGCNWGLALKKSRVVVMDVDRKLGKVGQQTLDGLTMEYGDLPVTLTVMSPSGGLHYYYNGEHRFGLGKFGFGVDVDSPNYVLIPGCWLCTNFQQGYQIITNAPVADAPEWFGELLKERVEKETAEAEPAVDLDKDPNVARMIKYLQEGAPRSVQGQNGDKVMFDVYAVLKDNGLSMQRAIEIVEEYYNTSAHCDPVWAFGSGPDRDRHDIKARNVWQYANENTSGTATAEYAFSDPADVIDPDEIKAYTAAWDKRFAGQKKARDKRRVDAYFATFDPLTGEPLNDVQYDPITGEAFGGTPGDEPPEDTPPGSNPPPPPPPPPGSGAPPPPSDDQPTNTDAPGLPPKSGQTFNWVRANWVWVVGIERFIRLIDGEMWSISQFDSYYNNLTQKSSVSKGLFATDEIRKVEKIVYRPGRGVMLEKGNAVNIWRPSPIVPKEGDTSTWNEHLNYLFQDENDCNAVLNWMAWVYQNQARKPNHGLLLIGVQTGTGKSFIARVLEQLIGPDNTQRPKNTSLKGDFNAWAERCKLCIIEELMQIGRREVANELRDTITESTIEVNIKNVNAHKVENYAALMAITNHRDAMPMDDTERRWLVIETQATRKENAYYKKLWPILESPDALAAIGYELKNRKLGDYDASYSPDTTAAREQMIELSRSDVEHFLYENKKNPPLSHNITTINDIIGEMNQSMQRQARLQTTVQNFIRAQLKGESIRQVRLPTSGKRVRLWALNGKAPLLRGRSDTVLAELYETERRQSAGVRSSDDRAMDDFGEEG